MVVFTSRGITPCERLLRTDRVAATSRASTSCQRYVLPCNIFAVIHHLQQVLGLDEASCRGQRTYPNLLHSLCHFSRNWNKHTKLKTQTLLSSGTRTQVLRITCSQRYIRPPQQNRSRQPRYDILVKNSSKPSNKQAIALVTTAGSQRVHNCARNNIALLQ